MMKENYIHICHVMLYHFEKYWKATQSICDFNDFFSEGTIRKAKGRHKSCT